MAAILPLSSKYVLLADDDEDDCLLFKDAIEELDLSVKLITVHNGEQLMQLLCQPSRPLPNIIFLDLNMPRKNGFECLAEIKQNEKLKQLPIIILSTSFNQDVVNLLYQRGAQHCIRKPNEFSKLKEVINNALTIITQSLCAGIAVNIAQPSKEDFVL